MKVGWCTTIYVKVPLFQGIFAPYDPSFMAYFGSIVLGNNPSVEPKVRLQGYGYNPFCSHSTRCLAVLV